jgi:hypothetical protein
MGDEMTDKQTDEAIKPMQDFCDKMLAAPAGPRKGFPWYSENAWGVLSRTEYDGEETTIHLDIVHELNRIAADAARLDALRNIPTEGTNAREDWHEMWQLIDRLSILGPFAKRFNEIIDEYLESLA